MFWALSRVEDVASDRCKVFLFSVVLGRPEVVQVVQIASNCSTLFGVVLGRSDCFWMFGVILVVHAL